MKWRIFGWTCFLWVVTAGIATAAPRINEVAWMGTTQSPSNEWIELYNDATLPVDLSGWKLETKDGSLVVDLSGIVISNGYFLIERTDDNSVPGVMADLVAPFGAGLSNSGEILRLIDKEGETIDVVDGGVNWANIGGNNKTKETAQRTGSGWTTGGPTPRRENVKKEIIVTVTKTMVDTASSSGIPSDVRTTVDRSLGSEIGDTKIEPEATATDGGATILWAGDSSRSSSADLFGSSFTQNGLFLWAFLLVVLFAFAGYIIVRSQKEEGSSPDDYVLVEDIIEGEE